MQDTLELDDADDGHDLRVALETAFGVRFSEAEAAGCGTVDDILHVLRSRFPAASGEGERCVTAMAFYRVRRAFAGMGVRLPLTPDTCLGTLTGLPARELLKELGRGSKLQLPAWKATLPGQVGGWMMLAGLIGLLLAAIVAPRLWFACVAVGLLGFVLTRVDPGRLPPDCQTLGELARKVAGLNFGTLQAQGAKPREQDLWDALVEVLSEHTALPKTGICPETAILRKRRRRS